MLQQFLVVLVADFPVEEAVICKQSDVGEFDCIRKIVDVSQEKKRSQNCTLGSTRQG